MNGEGRQTGSEGAAPYSREELERMAKSVHGWWHSIDLGQGVVTAGHKSAPGLQREVQSLRLPDLKGKTVLDIGAYDGFYSFHAERAGARRVVALDHFIWHKPLAGSAAGTLPRKAPYDLAHRVLGSRVETLDAEFMEMDLGALGTFDVVLYLGVLYHMKNPLAALERVAAVTGEVAIIETEAIVVPGYEDHAWCEFYETNELGNDASNWWAPNQKALAGLCRAAGFGRVEILAGPPQATGAARRPGLLARLKRALLAAVPPAGESDPAPQIQHYRAVAHAWK